MWSWHPWAMLSFRFATGRSLLLDEARSDAATPQTFDVFNNAGRQFKATLSL
ncbi:hypothetical protein EDWATA_00990 [Edwardsiella tarda ATCC 23685]|uniref:Uncharacterized protein n=1 Tax=Edwardsiella tarda ATCC 23685 TaxID=500638 RepID=D4F2N9_EDWTA|nr:hypothetical protein EDWATA_00990 [Edwardsiella tarda ATCC 23685]BEH73250.1 hypothetical protein GBS0709_23670 [Edwardsiella tarda]GAC65586.1 hypothetical protein ET1_20_00040 [Edwardsiella tarda ATCC 15947 = NBRC 105688]